MSIELDTTVPELDEDLWYEECPDCPHNGFCRTCWDSGYVPHRGCFDDEVVVVGP